MRLAHACIWAGARMSGAEVMTFRHNDAAHVAELLDGARRRNRHALVATEGVFSMDGDRAPLRQLARIAEAHDAWLMVDDAHGLGVLGQGRGSSFADGAPIPVPLQMGTLSKALGSYGGYLCAAAPVIELMKSRARPLIYSTGLPPASIAAAIAALDVIAREPRPDRAAADKGPPLYDARGPARSAKRHRAGASRRGECRARSLTLARQTRASSLPRSGRRPCPTARRVLRLTFCARHPDEAIDRLAALIRDRILRM